MKESENYEFLEKKGWFMKDARGNTVYGTPEDQRGALIDTTNPECGKWYFDTCLLYTSYEKACKEIDSSVMYCSDGGSITVRLFIGRGRPDCRSGPGCAG